MRDILPSVIHNDILEIINRAKNDLTAFEGKTILIAGAAGFLPSYLVHILAFANTNLFKKKCRVICLDNFKTGTAERLKPWRGRKDLRFLTRDVTKAVNLGEKVDYIIHGASIASPVWYRKFPLETIDANVSGTRRLLDLAKKDKAKGFLYLSSSEIYGNPPKQFIPTNEEYLGNVSATGPRACYDESKRLAETLCMVYFRHFGVPVKIVRPFNVYGPGLRLDDGRVVPDFIRDALSKKTITIFSDGKATRSFCYITDAVVAILMLLASDVSGEAFNVGNDEEVSVAKLAQVVNKVSGNESGIQFKVSTDKAYLTDNPQRRMPDLTKLKKAFKWLPEVSLVSGIDRTFKFYKGGS